MKTILKYVPGFRTGKLWKSIIALVYYGLSLIFLVKEGFSAFLMIAFMPFIIFAIISIVMDEKNKSFLITLICAILILCIGAQLVKIRKITAPTPTTQAPIKTTTNTPATP